MLKDQAYHWAKGELGEYVEHTEIRVLHSLELYAQCKEFGALPVEGGLYDQDPQLLTEWSIISEQIGIVHEEEREKMDANNKTNNTSAGDSRFKTVQKVPNFFNNSRWDRYHKEK